jgi:hypothetical protein
MFRGPQIAPATVAEQDWFSLVRLVGDICNCDNQSLGIHQALTQWNTPVCFNQITDQYSSGSKNVVTLRSHSVMIQILVPSSKG